MPPQACQSRQAQRMETGRDEMTEQEASLLQQEIREQPLVLARLLREETASVADIARELRPRDFPYVIIAARGTSDNAATYAKYLFGAVNHLPVALAAPSLFTLYRRPPLLGDSLVIGISQSGSSPDIVAVVDEGRRQGAATLAITNTDDSLLAQAAEYVIRCHAGEERSIAATKTYTAQLTALALLSASLANDAQRLDAIRRLPQALEQIMILDDEIQEGVARYRYMEHCVVIGRGYNYSTAFEIALKIKELTYVLAQPYSSADFLHGPIALVAEGFPAIIVAPQGRTYDDLLRLIHSLQEKAAEMMVISDRDEALASAKTPLRLPVCVEEWLSPVACLVPGQLVACHLARTKGYHPDRPRGLRKVTRTF